MVIPPELHQKLKEHDEKSRVYPLETWGWHAPHWTKHNVDHVRYCELLGNGGIVVDLFDPRTWKQAILLCAETGVRLGLAIHPFQKNNPDPHIDDAASRYDRNRIETLLKRFVDEIGADQVGRVFIDAETYWCDRRLAKDVVAWNRAIWERHHKLYGDIARAFGHPPVEWYGHGPWNFCCTLRESPYKAVASCSLYRGHFEENQENLLELINWSVAAGYESTTAWLSLGVRYAANKWHIVEDPQETWKLAHWVGTDMEFAPRLHRAIDYLAFSKIPANVNYAQHLAAWHLGLRGMPKMSDDEDTKDTASR